MNRLIWNIYTAIYIAAKCCTSILDGWRCAKESTDMYEVGMWPSEVAELESEVREVERGTN